MGYAIFGIIVIIAGGLAYMSSKTWRWPNVTLIFLIACIAPVFVFLAAYALSVNHNFRKQIPPAEAQIVKLEAERHDLLHGTKDAEGRFRNGIQQYQLALHDLVVRRGPVWYDVAIARAAAADGATEVTIDAPDPHGLAPNTVVYAFDTEPFVSGGRYLGEFVVTDAPAGSKQVKLAPNMAMSPTDLQRLRAPKKSWTLYQKMPLDGNDVFTALTDEQAKAILPPDLPEAYRKGERPEADMADFAYLFHEYSMQRGLLVDANAKTASNIARLEESEKRNQKKIQDREQEKEALLADQTGFETEKGLITQYRGVLEAKAKQLEAEVAKVKAENLALEIEIKRLQLEAAERINRRTETAQAGS